jgi:hypothetical protein
MDMNVGGIATKKRDVSPRAVQDDRGDNTDHKKKDVSLLDEPLVGVKLLKQDSMNAANYKSPSRPSRATTTEQDRLPAGEALRTSERPPIRGGGF